MNVIERLKSLPLEVKILLLIVICLVSGFGSYVVYSIHEESQALLKQHREKSHLFAQTLKAGIRNVMLSGRSAYVRSLVEESREEFQNIGKLRIFNNKGEEIFPHSSPFIHVPLQDINLQDAILNNKFSHSLIPLYNETKCQTCHTSDHEIRGSIQVSYSNLTEPDISGKIIQQAFETIMLSGKGEMADSLLFDLIGIENINLVQVWDGFGYYVAFGDDKIEIPENIIEPIADKFQENPNQSHIIINHDKYGLLTFMPLANSPSCHVCHGGDDPLRGILVVGIDSSNEIKENKLTENIITGFKNLMLLQKASYAYSFTDRIRNLPFIQSLRVFDNGIKNNGQVRELYVPNPDYSIMVSDSSIINFIGVAQSKQNHILERIDYIDDVKYLTQVIPLENDEKCQGCHNPPKKGSPLYEIEKEVWKVRCVVEVSTSMAEIQEAIQRNKRASIGVGIITILFVSILLRIFMKIMVLKPLEIIGSTAQKIGQGDLSVNADVGSTDEIGTLALRMNEMIQGLRERLHLTKFVSDDTVEAVGSADLSGVQLGGERREATVLFSDIRGFTSYSENVEPEEVITMLNTYLNRQAVIVKEHNGDIDKFVGDELMAIFKGDNMVENAIQCAIAIQQKMDALNQDVKKPIGIGIGINAGPMVMGAMGSKDRMDYTVLGDNVNLGARLCSAAKSGEIIISQLGVNYLQNSEQFKLVEEKAIQVKGKQSAIKIYTVDYSSTGLVGSG